VKQIKCNLAVISMQQGCPTNIFEYQRQNMILCERPNAPAMLRNVSGLGSALLCIQL